MLAQNYNKQCFFSYLNGFLLTVSFPPCAYKLIHTFFLFMYVEPDRDIRIRITVEAYRQQQHSQRNTFLFMHISLKGNMDFNVYYVRWITLCCVMYGT